MRSYASCLLGLAAAFGAGCSGRITPSPTASLSVSGASSGQTGAGTSGTTSGTGGDKTPGSAQAGDVTIDPGTVHQRIAGFGASSAWEGGYLDPTNDPQTLFGTTGSSAGLTLFRVRIQPNPPGTTSAGEIAMAKAAQDMGATVWATPWTPPSADKSNENMVEGTLTDPSAWAASLASYVTTMKNAGINIYAISSQNEPDANVNYESCSYSASTLATFVGSSMGPALAGTGVKLMTPETQSWETFDQFLAANVGDSAAWAASDIIAVHEYGGAPAPYPMIAAAGKELWETEYYPMDGEDATIVDGLEVADEIVQALTIASVNAWHYWWFYPGGPGDNQGLWDKGISGWAKRLYVMGNFSRWARPGDHRIDVEGSPTDISIAAFVSATSGMVSIVAINAGTADETVPFFVVGNNWPSAVTPWVTSGTENLEAGTPIVLTAGRFSATVPAQSVTTFVGAP
jgi:glucuronoarabinoxylan endo-1,4-beta-xylanase